MASESVLRSLVKEWKATGPTYRTTLRTVSRSSYQSHYRRIVPAHLEALTFRSNNEAHRPVIEALDLLKRYRTSRAHNYPLDEEVPFEGVVRRLWREAVVSEDPSGELRVNRITHEICALEALREKLRCKEIWVEGADRYRNPEEDLPQDFEEQREAYYAALELPSEADRFTDLLRQEMIEGLDLGALDQPESARADQDGRADPGLPAPAPSGAAEPRSSQRRRSPPSTR